MRGSRRAAKRPGTSIASNCKKPIYFSGSVTSELCNLEEVVFITQPLRQRESEGGCRAAGSRDVIAEALEQSNVIVITALLGSTDTPLAAAVGERRGARSRAGVG